MHRILSLLLSLYLTISPSLPALSAEEPVEPTQAEVEVSEALDPRVEAMIAWALETAEDPSHGYSKRSRFGPDYDCSSFVSTALMEGGFGLTDYLFPADMVEELPKLGFEVYRRGETEPQRGDILVQPYVHAEICMGDGGCVGAHQDYDWRSGDSKGHEIEYRTPEGTYNCPFCDDEAYTYILRFNPDLAPVYLTVTDYSIPQES